MTLQVVIRWKSVDQFKDQLSKLLHKHYDQYGIRIGLSHESLTHLCLTVACKQRVTLQDKMFCVILTLIIIIIIIPSFKSWRNIGMAVSRKFG